jgi:hypothetical protein
VFFSSSQTANHAPATVPTSANTPRDLNKPDLRL